MSLTTNIPHASLIAQSSAVSAEKTVEISMERLGTGLKINRAGDDSAGLAIAQRHKANILGLAGAVRNSANTQSMLSVADNALAGVGDTLVRINELAASAQNPAITNSELKMIQKEIDHLIAEIDRNSNSTHFNQTALLDGTLKNSTALVGAQAGDGISFSIAEASSSSLGAYVFYADGVAPSTAAASAAVNPVTTAEDITVKGSIGSYKFNAINEESAKNLASRVNARNELTGVQARAKTEALLSSTSANDEPVRLLINGSVTDQFSFSSTNFREAKLAINRLTNVTGISAEATNGGIRVKSADGDDITIENMEATTDLRVRKVSADGSNYVGPEVELQASGNNDATRVTGTLMLSSSESFGVSEDGATSSENIVIQTDASISQTLGDVSIINGFIYLGTGGNADAIGSIDPIQNGQNGQPLKINLGQFGNNDFETGNSGDTTISGWSVSNNQIKLNGASTLGGQPTATDTDFPTPTANGFAAPYDQMTPSSATYRTKLSTETSSGSGLSVRMRSTGVNVNGYGIVHGPAIVSDSSVKLNPGDSVSFEWRATGGGDAYDVIGYLVDENTGHIEEILNETGADASASTSWATVTRDITTSGTYKFVFVAGTWDATGGTVAGAQLYIDNIAVSQNSKAPLADDIVGQIRTALTTSRNGYMQPLEMLSTGDELSFTITESNVATLVPLKTLDLRAHDGAAMAKTLAFNSLNQVVTARADLGALSNRLNSAAESAMIIKEGVTSAKGKILDADYALESARFARGQILKETSTSLLAKSNELNEVVLNLLKDD